MSSRKVQSGVKTLPAQSRPEHQPEIKPQQRPAPTPERHSKVREYIREMKRNDEDGARKAANPRPSVGLSLEDLYDISEGNSLSPETAKKELRKTLRVVKERDMVILKLKEACHDLTLKYADAENTIDQLRFGIMPGGIRRSKSEFSIAKVETRDQATETKVEVLSESCSNWMEKVQNWKTDSTFNASADADSGFRGSELETRTRKGSCSSHVKKSTYLDVSPKGEQSSGTLHTVGTNTEQHVPIEVQPKIKSQSYSDINYIFGTTSIRSGTQDKSLDKIYAQRRLSTDHFKTLDPLLDEATVLARRVQRKSRRLAKMMQCMDKKI